MYGVLLQYVVLPPLKRLKALGVLRMIKLFAWENHAKEQLTGLRETELVQIRWGRILDTALGIINSLLPFISKLVVFATYVRPLHHCFELIYWILIFMIDASIDWHRHWSSKES